ncbi:MAG: response regulator transcription factor [Gemmatimonadaceae bacterium]
MARGGVLGIGAELLDTAWVRSSSREREKQAEPDADHLSIGLVNPIGRPLVAFDTAGTVLLRSAALTSLLETEPGRLAIIDASSELASAFANAVRPNGSGEEHGSWVAGRAVTVRPHRRAYTLLPVLARAGIFAPATSVIVIIERASQPAQVNLEQVRKELQLTPRESQALALLLARYSTAEIARALGVSSHTARHHIERVCRKARVSGRAGLHSALVVKRTE